MKILKLDECEFYVQVCGLRRGIFEMLLLRFMKQQRKNGPIIETYKYFRIFAVGAKMTQRLPTCLHTELIERAERWN
jgi:hypothetical protein